MLLCSMTFNLSEVFYSIQGEGPYAGLPCVFVRFSGCNLRCQWGENRCDTPYTSWEPEQNLVEMEEILDQIKSKGEGCKDIVITGGEPTLQHDLPKLCETLRQDGYRLHIETNGTGKIPDTIDVIVCSPKLKDSIPSDPKLSKLHEEKRGVSRNLINGEDPRVYLKFVVTESTDISELLSLTEDFCCPPERTYLMPEALTAEDLESHAPYVWSLSLKHGFKYTSRLHIQHWDGERGR